VNTVTVSFNTIMGQMTETSQRKKAESGYLEVLACNNNTHCSGIVNSLSDETHKHNLLSFNFLLSFQELKFFLSNL